MNLTRRAFAFACAGIPMFLRGLLGHTLNSAPSESTSTLDSPAVAQPDVLQAVADAALKQLQSNFRMANLVNRDYAPSRAQAGDTVNVPIPPLDNKAPRVLGNAQIVLNKHIEASFILPIDANQELISTYVLPAILAITERIESDLLALVPQFTANKPVGTLGVPITAEDIDSADTNLFVARAPMKKHLVVASPAYGNLRRLPRFTEYGSDETANGKMNGFLVYRNLFVPQDANGHRNLAFARDAIGLIIRRAPQIAAGRFTEFSVFAESGDLGIRVDKSKSDTFDGRLFTISVLYGCGVLRNNFGVQVQS